MGLFIAFLFAYLTMGLFFAIRHLGSGKVGAAGPAVTFFSIVLGWPLFTLSGDV